MFLSRRIIIFGFILFLSVFYPPLSFGEEKADSENDLKKALPDLIDKAFDDPSTRSNPRFPMVDEIEELFHLAYEGKL